MKEQEEIPTQYDDENWDHFSRLMFGNRLQRDRELPRKDYTDEDYREEKGSYSQEQQNILKTLENIDYLQLMENIDSIMASAKKLKPLMQQIQPIMKSLLKK